MDLNTLKKMYEKRKKEKLKYLEKRKKERNIKI